MNIGFQLFQLQSIDSEIDRADKRMREIADLLASNEAVGRAQSKLKASQAKSEQVRSDFELINRDIQQKQVKKSQSEAALYAGKIQNPKELQDLQAEIASLTKILADLDEELVRELMHSDEADEEVHLKEADLKQAFSAFETKKSMLVAENGNLETTLRNLQTKRTSLVSQIDPSFLRTYESQRKSKNGLAVARLQDDACSACGSSLTPSQCQKARSTSQLFLCPSCGRIVYGA